jgi:hypothetical protein
VAGFYMASVPVSMCTDIFLGRFGASLVSVYPEDCVYPNDYVYPHDCVCPHDCVYPHSLSYFCYTSSLGISGLTWAFIPIPSYLTKVLEQTHRRLA